MWRNVIILSLQMPLRGLKHDALDVLQSPKERVHKRLQHVIVNSHAVTFRHADALAAVL